MFSLNELASSLDIAPDRAAIPVFGSMAAAVVAIDHDQPVHCVHPLAINIAAREFLDGFHGDTLYAVKVNPHPAILERLIEAGVRHFDVASTREMMAVKALLPDASIAYMHPVKSRQAIARAYGEGARTFAFDSGAELHKILEETGNARDLTLVLRLAVTGTGAALDLSGKFGATGMEAADLLRQAASISARVGLSFHVGSQNMDPESFTSALGHLQSGAAAPMRM